MRRPTAKPYLAHSSSPQAVRRCVVQGTARGQIHPDKTARTTLGPLKMIGAHPKADLQHVQPSAVLEPSEIADVWLESVTRPRLGHEPLFSGRALRVDLAARPERFRTRGPQLSGQKYAYQLVRAGGSCKRASIRTTSVSAVVTGRRSSCSMIRPI